MSQEPPPGARPGDLTGAMTDAGDLVRVQLRQEADAAVLVLVGEVDVSNVEVVRAAAAQISNRAAGLVVDLRELDYIDSSGISLLYDLAERLRQHRQQLVLVCPPEAQPRRVLDLTGLTDQVAVHADLPGALRELNAGS